jgi:hypothetical protein
MTLFVPRVWEVQVKCRQGIGRKQARKGFATFHRDQPDIRQVCCPDAIARFFQIIAVNFHPNAICFRVVLSQPNEKLAVPDADFKQQGRLPTENFRPIRANRQRLRAKDYSIKSKHFLHEPSPISNFAIAPLNPEARSWTLNDGADKIEAAKQMRGGMQT